MPSYAADFEEVVTASAYPFEMELTVLTIDAGAPSGGKLIVAVNMLVFAAPGFASSVLGQSLTLENTVSIFAPIARFYDATDVLVAHFDMSADTGSRGEAFVTDNPFGADGGTIRLFARYTSSFNPGPPAYAKFYGCVGALIDSWPGLTENLTYQDALPSGTHSDVTAANLGDLGPVVHVYGVAMSICTSTSTPQWHFSSSPVWEDVLSHQVTQPPHHAETANVAITTNPQVITVFDATTTTGTVNKNFVTSATFYTPPVTGTGVSRSIALQAQNASNTVLTQSAFNVTGAISDSAGLSLLISDTTDHIVISTTAISFPEGSLGARSHIAYNAVIYNDIYRGYSFAIGIGHYIDATPAVSTSVGFTTAVGTVVGTSAFPSSVVIWSFEQTTPLSLGANQVSIVG